jgi:Tol biopolymer transport system component
METTKIPVTWGNLNLTGKLIYISSNSGGDDFTPGIRILDLVTGETGTVFRAPQGAWIFYLDISPDGKQVIFSYIDPEQSNASSNRALYIMPLDASTPPNLLLTPPSADDHYTQAEWSSNGKYIYYSHYNNKKEPIDSLTPDYDIYRITYPDGSPEKIAEHALWPRLSSDSKKLVYVFLNRDTGINELVVANADGSDPKQVPFSDPWTSNILDAPIFTPDGQSILFSVPTPTEAYRRNWVDILTGVRVVQAHSIPSDWWSVPVAGGTPTRLTQIETVNLFGSILPDQQHLVSISGEGLFVMGLDGSNLTRLLTDAGIYGSVRWLP